MLCPKCKNPIDAHSITCEWCGAVINKEVYEKQYAGNTAKTVKPVNSNKGTFGIVALVCGILGIFLIPIPLALVFGVLGWGKKKKHRKLAVAGFVLAILWIILYIIVGVTS